MGCFGRSMRLCSAPMVVDSGGGNVAYRGCIVIFSLRSY